MGARAIDINLQYRNFLTRNSEHLVAGVHLWCWIYYDFASIFPHKYSKINSSGILNSTTHGIICLVFLWMLRTIKEAKEYKMTRYNSFTTIACTFAIHFILSMIVIHRVESEIIVPKLYEHISPNWWKYVICTYLCTFFSIEALSLLQQSCGSYVSPKLEMSISVACYFILISINRILFHLQITYD